MADDGQMVAVKAALVRERRLLVVQRGETDRSAPGMWEFCGGHVEYGEQPQDALLREIMEETGLAAAIGPLLYLTSFTRGESPNGRQVFIAAYLARARPGDVRLSFEHQAYRWATRVEARALLGQSVVRDMDAFQVWDCLGVDE